MFVVEAVVVVGVVVGVVVVEVVIVIVEVCCFFFVLKIGTYVITPKKKNLKVDFNFIVRSHLLQQSVLSN